MTKTTMVHVRMSGRLKGQAERALAAMGLSISDAVRVFLTRVAVEKALPFEVRVPNPATRAAIEEARAGGLESFANVSELIRNLDAKTD